MPMRGPTIAELRTLAQSYGLHCDDDELAKYCALIAAQADSYARLEQLAEPTCRSASLATPAIGQLPKTIRWALGIGDAK